MKVTFYNRPFGFHIQVTLFGQRQVRLAWATDGHGFVSYQQGYPCQMNFDWWTRRW